MSSLVDWQQIDRVLKARDEPIEVEWGKLPKRLRREVPFIERVIASGRRGKHMHRAEPLVSVGLDACAYAAGASGHQEGIDHLVGSSISRWKLRTENTSPSCVVSSPEKARRRIVTKSRIAVIGFS